MAVWERGEQGACQDGDDENEETVGGEEAEAGRWIQSGRNTRATGEIQKFKKFRKFSCSAAVYLPGEHLSWSSLVLPALSTPPWVFSSSDFRPEAPFVPLRYCPTLDSPRCNLP